jgi:exopolyphosphatase/guanosine-5'-triphosphate,3'-diphosphate pyrophosphatase
MRLAAIDLGSNTVHLLVADVGPGGTPWQVVDSDQRVTRLGEGLAASGRLGEAPTARTTAVVVEYVARARAAGAERVAIVATSAVREASNRADFVARLERAAGERVRVVTGEEEAALTLAGVVHGLGPGLGQPLDGTTLMFDIGGGSTEYVLVQAETAVAAVSLRLGVVDLAERHPFPGRVDWARYQALYDEVAGRLARELPPTIRGARPGRIVGTAGTVTALAVLDLGLSHYDRARVQGHTMTRATVERLLQRLGALTVAERGALPCLEPARADIIVPGTAVVLATLKAFGAAGLVVSDAALREGVVLRLREGALGELRVPAGESGPPPRSEI